MLEPLQGPVQMAPVLSLPFCWAHSHPLHTYHYCGCIACINDRCKGGAISPPPPVGTLPHHSSCWSQRDFRMAQGSAVGRWTCAASRVLCALHASSICDGCMGHTKRLGDSKAVGKHCSSHCCFVEEPCLPRAAMLPPPPPPVVFSTSLVTERKGARGDASRHVTCASCMQHPCFYF